MIMRTMDDEIKLAHDTLLKCKEQDCRVADEDGRYSITGLTAEQMKTIWHALSMYEGELRDRNEQTNQMDTQQTT